MKTLTILSAWLQADLSMDPVRERQAETFREKLTARIEAGDRAREALQKVEWTEPDDDSYCPWCGNYKSFRHAPDCPRQLALGISDVTE